jgi:hypothetical protein
MSENPGTEKKAAAEEQQPSQSFQLNKWIPILISAAAFFLSFSMIVFGDNRESLVYAAIIVFLVAALIGIWIIPSLAQQRKILFTLIPIAIAAGLALYSSSKIKQLSFEITALETLPGDKNAYELTDNLIRNQAALDKFNAEIKFSFEIIPHIGNSQPLGNIVARISGNGSGTINKLLWQNFPAQLDTKKIELSLAELLSVLTPQWSTDNFSFPDSVDKIPSQELKIQIFRESDMYSPLETQTVTIRNTPWVQSSRLVWRNGHPEVDFRLINLGGTGNFKILYDLTRVDKEIDPNIPDFIWSGTTSIPANGTPNKWDEIKAGESKTYTIPISDQLPRGRYVLQAYTAKQQNNVEFIQAGTSWDNYNKLYLFSNISDQMVFLETAPLANPNPVIQSEYNRVKQEGVDLGDAISSIEDYTSPFGSYGQKQSYQKGDIYLLGDKAYAVYGPILTFYEQAQAESQLGFPLSIVQTVKSNNGESIQKMTFESQNSSSDQKVVVYATAQGIKQTEGWIMSVYQENGGETGWLGLPVSNIEEQNGSLLQLFENGYIYEYQPVVDGKTDFDRKPVAIPYLSSRGNIIDVDANQSGWQDTGISIHAGDTIQIIQIGGTWTYRDGVAPFDANGTLDFSLQENSLLPSAPIGALIVKVGEDSSFTYLSGRWSETKSKADGELYLAMNDNGYGDNRGKITVEIFVGSK